MTSAADRAPFAVEARGKRTLLKPPFSEGLVSGCVTLAPGEEVGVHRTEAREEVIVVLSGRATVICGGERLTVNAKQLAYIPSGQEHNVVNESDRQLEYVYVVASVGEAGMTPGHHGRPA